MCGGTSTELNYFITPKTSLFFSFYGGSWSFMLSLSIIYACFYACCVEFFVLSIIIVSPKEHPGLGAASARRHRTFLRARGRDGRGERRRPWRVELGAGRRGVGGGVELGLGGGREACFMPPPSGFIVVPFSAFFFAHFMQIFSPPAYPGEARVRGGQSYHPERPRMTPLL